MHRPHQPQLDPEASLEIASLVDPLNVSDLANARLSAGAPRNTNVLGDTGFGLSFACSMTIYLIIIGFIVAMGIFTFDIDTKCNADIGTWGTVAFWLLIGYLAFGLLAMALNYSGGLEKSKVELIGGGCIVAAVAVILFLTSYVWGIVALFNSDGVVECNGLYWVDVGFVVFVSALIVVALCVCFFLCCVAASFVGNNVENMGRLTN